MGKLDPIISEFDTEEAAEAYDAWFRAQVEAALAEKGPGISHKDAMARIRKTIEDRSRAKPDLAA